MLFLSFILAIVSIHDYLEEKTLSKASVDLNESITLPNPTVCMQFSFNITSQHSSNFQTGQETNSFLHNNKLKIINYFRYLLSVVDSQPAIIDVHESYIRHPHDETDILFPILRLTQDLIDQVHTSNKQPRSTVNTSYPIATLKRPYHYLNGFFNENNISLAEVVKATAMYMCILVGLHQYINDYVSGFRCERRYLTWLGSDSVCVRYSQTPNIFVFTAQQKDISLQFFNPIHETTSNIC